MGILKFNYLRFFQGLLRENVKPTTFLNSHKKILFLLFSPLYAKGGHSKNFLNLVKYLLPEIQLNEIDAKIISYNNNAKDIEVNRQQRIKNIFLNVYKIKFFVRIFPSGKTVFQLFEFVVNSFRTFYQIIKYKPDVVYCYAEKPLFLTFIWKRMLKFKLIFDKRGDSINELKVKGARIVNLIILEKFYQLACRKVDLLFSVSDTFRQEKIFNVVPKFNYYDGDVFNYRQEQAVQKRHSNCRQQTSHDFVPDGGFIGL